MPNKHFYGHGEPLVARSRSILTLSLTAAGALAAAVALRAAPAKLARGLAHPGRWLDAVGVDAAVGTLAAAALWLLAAWVIVGLVAALAGRLPGAAGALARRTAMIALPRALYRAAAGAAGLGIVLSPAVASAAAPHPGGTPGASSPVPAPLIPTSSVRVPQLPIAHPPDTSDTRSPDRHAPVPRPGTEPVHALGQRTGTVTVRPGDSLWRIAAAHLGRAPSAARVAAAWPRWFGANRAVIGADPDLLLPGEVLHAPHS